MSAETAIVDYRFLFADQVKQTLRFTFPFAEKKIEVCQFRFPFAENKRKWPFSISSIFCLEIQKCGDMEKWRNGDMETCRHRHGDMVNGEMETCSHRETENGKWKPRRLSLYRLPFAHRANGSLAFVSLLMKKQTEVICLQTDLTDLTSLPIYAFYSPLVTGEINQC